MSFCRNLFACAKGCAFKPVSLAHQARYLECLATMPQATSEYTFGNLWAWAEEYGLSLAFEADYALILQTRPSRVLWAPVGRVDARTVAGHPTVAGHLARGLAMERVPTATAQELALAFADKGLALSVTESREHWDYIYQTDDLVNLAGNRFHKKKNLLNQFLKRDDWEYHTLSGDCVEEVLVMQHDWCTWRGGECLDGDLCAENRAIERVLTSWDEMPGMRGGVITVGGRVAAYTVAEALGPDTVVIHFEKGHTEFKGIYQAINQLFLAHDGSGFTYVNREQDLGDEGLRKAKLSYNPIRFGEKSALRQASPV